SRDREIRKNSCAHRGIARILEHHGPVIRSGIKWSAGRKYDGDSSDEESVDSAAKHRKIIERNIGMPVMIEVAHRDGRSSKRLITVDALQGPAPGDCPIAANCDQRRSFEENSLVHLGNHRGDGAGGKFSGT